MNESARSRCLRHDNDTGAAVRILRHGLAALAALGKFQKLGSGVQEQDGGIFDAGSLSDAVHLLDISRVEGRDRWLVFTGDLADIMPAQLAPFQLRMLRGR